MARTGCPGYTLAHEAEALLVLLEWADSSGWKVRVKNMPAHIWGAYVDDRQDQYGEATGATPFGAVGAALVKALGLTKEAANA